jgi:hypothetical protein
MRVRKEHFERLLAPHEARDVFASPLVTECRIEWGEIRVKESLWLSPRVLEKYPDLFLSFARLGGNRTPRDASINKWVEKYGLPRRLPRHGEKRARGSPMESYMYVQEFIEEARSAHQLLRLYQEIQGRELELIEARARDPQSSLDEALKAAFEPRPYREARVHLTLSAALSRLYTQEDLKQRARDEVSLYTSLRVLTDAVAKKTERAQFRLVAKSSSNTEQVWRCPDLLSALYLQLHLLIDDRRPMRSCRHCGTPFPLTRTNKRFCNDSCRSGGRKPKQR